MPPAPMQCHAPTRLLALLLSLALTGSILAADWPPTLDSNNPTTKSADGRTIERYTHGPRESWEYPASASGEWEYPPPQETGPKQQNHSSFYVVAPKQTQAETPLCVVLHSANRTAYDYMGFDCLERSLPERGDFHTVMTKAPQDFYALFLNSTNAEWWGWGQIRRQGDKTPGQIAPAERRVFDTIEWVVNHYHIDRNRIYLCGVSMGGCGTLGLGIPHGDVFAAIKATVPAGTEYVSYRMGGFLAAPTDASAADREAWTKHISAAGLPDPPIIVDFSAQNDNWSKTQPPLLQAALAGRWPLVLSWGLFGHATFANLVAKYAPCEVALAFPWLEIRRNEAYPVFTHASTDQRSPWLDAPTEFDEAGQMNAWFRWKNTRDTPASFAMELWLDHPKIANPLTPPETATADLTLRRLQRFKVQSGAAYRWELRRSGKTVGSGRITPDAANLLTIPQASVTTEPTVLSLEAEK